jgi:hypothetical protein
VFHLPPGLGHGRDRGDLDDRAGAVGRVGPLVEDVGLVAGLVAITAGFWQRMKMPLLASSLAQNSARIDEVGVRDLGDEVARVLAARGRLDRTVDGAPVGIADAIEVVEAASAVDQHGRAAHAGAAGQGGGERQRQERAGGEGLLHRVSRGGGLGVANTSRIFASAGRHRAS